MYNTIKKIIRESKKLVFFTGAGMSTESGIPDFRSADGLYSKNDYKKFPPEQILSRSFFLSKPDIFYKYYFEKIVHRNALPNAGHLSIAKFEANYDVTVVTQNIDGLHGAAGSTHVLELHGSVYRNKCMNCGMKYNLDEILKYAPGIPKCKICQGITRPDVTLYEEPLEQEVFAHAVSRIADADILFAIGSSLTVYPAAGLLNYFKGRTMVIINHSETTFDKQADFVIRDGCGSVLTEIAGF